MNLYKVTCVCARIYSRETLDVYVVAPEPTIAENKALKFMKKQDYKYDNYVAKIKLIASTEHRKAERFLVIA